MFARLISSLNHSWKEWRLERLHARWESFGTLYVSSFEAELAASAAWLSKRLNKRVWSRISQKQRRAELRTVWGGLVATVNVNGECCAPYEAVVASNLSEEDKTIFDRLFHVPVEHKALA